MQMKTTMNYHYYSYRMAKMKKYNIKYWWGYSNWNSHSLLIGMQNGTAPRKNSSSFLNIHLIIYRNSTPGYSIPLGEMKT